jgi:hypothetical protein
MVNEVKTTNLSFNILGKDEYKELVDIANDELWIVKEQNSDIDNAIASKTYADVGRESIYIGNTEPTSEHTKIWIDTDTEGTDYILPADIDLSNLTENGKNKILDSILPDYNSAESIASITNELWSVGGNGYIYVSVGENSSIKIRRTNSSGEILTNIDTLSSAVKNISDKIVIEKDEVIYIEKREGNVELIFYPFKGVL